jgi:polar amino acid transport system permease protein
MTFDVNYALQILPLLLQGAVVTVQVTIVAMALALVGGLVLALARMSSIRGIRWVANFIVEFVRSTPLLIQLFFVFYILPLYGFQLSPFLTGVLALGVHYSAYTSEVYRAGITRVPRGQWEASVALNMSPARTWTRVILPQAIPVITPILGNYLIGMFKETPILFTISVQELFSAATGEAGRTYRFFEPMTMVGLIFLALSLGSALFIRKLEKRLAPA